MAPLPAVAGVVKCEFEFSLGSNFGAVIMHTAYSSDPPSSADLSSAVYGMANAFSDTVMGNFNGDVVFNQLVMTDLSSDTAASESAPQGVQGGESSGTVPASACVMTSYPVGMRYRGGHPRSYWPALGGGSLDTPGTWHASNIADFQGNFQTFFDNWVNSLYGSLQFTTWVCVRYLSGGAVLVPPLVLPLNSFNISNVIRSQRRRLTSTSL